PDRLPLAVTHPITKYRGAVVMMKATGYTARSRRCRTRESRTRFTSGTLRNARRENPGDGNAPGLVFRATAVVLVTSGPSSKEARDRDFLRDAAHPPDVQPPAARRRHSDPSTGAQ